MINSHLFDTMANRSDRLRRGSITGRKHHLHRKTSVLPSELSNAYALLISQSDRQCFSHEDGCFAAGNELHNKSA
jgi:hypothetical protein